MNRFHTLGAAVLLALAADASFASQPLTREAVIADLREALRTGDIVTGYSGLMRNEIAPSSYPPKPVVPGKTRAEVVVELVEARRTGNIYSYELGAMANEIDPQNYPAVPRPVGKTRAQVRAELAEAVRTGDIMSGVGGLKLYELYPERYRAARALSAEQAAIPTQGH